MAEKDQTTMWVIVGIVALCCCLSIGVAAFVYMNDDANAWFKKTFGFGDKDSDTPSPSPEAASSEEIISPETDLVDAGPAANAAAAQEENELSPEEKQKDATATYGVRKGYFCPKPWEHYASNKNKCCPWSARESGDESQCVSNPRPIKAGSNLDQRALRKLMQNETYANQVKGNVQWGNPPCLKGSSKMLHFKYMYKDGRVGSVHYFNDNLEDHGVCRATCRATGSGNNKKWQVPNKNADGCEKIEPGTNKFSRGTGGVTWAKWDKRTNYIHNLLTRGYKLTPEKCTCKGDSYSMKISKKDGDYGCITFDDFGAVKEWTESASGCKK